MLAKVNGGGTERMLLFRVCMLFFNDFVILKSVNGVDSSKSKEFRSLRSLELG